MYTCNLFKLPTSANKTIHNTVPPYTYWLLLYFSVYPSLAFSSSFRSISFSIVRNCSDGTFPHKDQITCNLDFVGLVGWMDGWKEGITFVQYFYVVLDRSEQQMLSVSQSVLVFVLYSWSWVCCFCLSCPQRWLFHSNNHPFPFPIHFPYITYLGLSWWRYFGLWLIL